MVQWRAGSPVFTNSYARRHRVHSAFESTKSPKFTPAGGQVRVALERRGESCRVVVRDTGVGIEPENLDRIFEPFVQSERTRHGKGGLGIGLALVRELATRQGASVRAASAGPGKDSEFTIRLPLMAPPTSTVAVPNTSWSLSEPSQERSPAT